MQKRFLIGLTLMLVYNSSFACDLCTIYLGIQPNDFKNSAGIRYRYRVFEKDYEGHSFSAFNNGNKKGGTDKHGASETETTESYTYSEAYNSYDIFVNAYLHAKWQLNISTYFADNYVYKNDSIIDNIGGIGDINLLLKFQVFNSQNNCDTIPKNKLIHRLSTGFGVTLPTGNFNKTSIVGYETDFTLNGIIVTPTMGLDPHTQAGTGALGYLFVVEYLLKRNALGLNTSVSYKLNTTNRNGFKFANRINSNLSLFLLLKAGKKLKLMPQVGMAYEQSARDTDNNEPFLGSGGQALFSNLGLSLFFKKLRFGVDYYLPVYENLYDDQPLNKVRLISQINYYF